MGRCMSVLIVSFTIFLLLFSITVPSTSSLECYEKQKNQFDDLQIQTCTKDQMCHLHTDSHFDDYFSYSSCIKAPIGLEPGCYATEDKSSIDCYCITNKCNTLKNWKNFEWHRMQYVYACNYLEEQAADSPTEGSFLLNRNFYIEKESMCYIKTERDLKTSHVTKKAGIMSNKHCQSLNIPQGKKCARKYENNHGHGPTKDIIECCCNDAIYCNVIREEDLPKLSAEPLKCTYPESKEEKYCDTTFSDAICWYQEKQDMATKQSPSQTGGQCVDKTKHKECNTITENTCKRSYDENAAITTVDCCCKQNGCNTPNGLASQLAMQPISAKCYDFHGSFDQNVKRCNKDEACWYQEKQNTATNESAHTGNCVNKAVHKECDMIQDAEQAICIRTNDENTPNTTVQCCCKQDKCNKPEGLASQLKMQPIPLRCHAFNGTFDKNVQKWCNKDEICWYKHAINAEGTEVQTGECKSKAMLNECNMTQEAEATCMRTTDENTTTVQCCCKQNECNTPENLASPLEMQPTPLKCYAFNGTFDKNVKKWCSQDEICLYQEKLQMTSEGLISAQGHCAKNDLNVCKAGINTCNRMARDKDGKSQMDCCCNSTLCNTPEEQKKSYQPPKEMKCFQSMTAHNASNSEWCMNENQVCRLQSKQVLGIADTVMLWKGECIEKANSDKTTKKQVCHQDDINKCIRSLNKDDPDKPISQVDCCCDTENCNNHKNANFTIPKLDMHKCMTFKQGETTVSKFCKERDEICWYKLEQTLGQEKLQDIMEQGGCKKGATSIGCTRLTPERQQNKDLKNSQVECYCKEDDCNSRSKLKINEKFPIDVIKCYTKAKDAKTGASKYCQFKGDVCQYKSTQTLGTENGKVQEEGGCVDKCPPGIKNGTCDRDPKQMSMKNAITTVVCCCNDGHDCNDPAKLKDKIPPVPTPPPVPTIRSTMPVLTSPATKEEEKEELDTVAPEEQPEETAAAAATRVQLKVVTIIAMLIAVVQHL